MVDARSESSDGGKVIAANPGLAWMNKQVGSWIGIFAFVTAGIVWADPALREQVTNTYVSMTTPAEPAQVAAAPAVAAEVIPVAEPVASKVQALGGNLVAAVPVAAVPTEHASPAQIEALRRYIARKYRVSHDATEMLVKTAYGVGHEMELDPLVLLSVMAIESSFNPFAESGMGAQGLMQVMTRVHREKFESFGGLHAAWNPIANVRVGAQILQDCIARGGSLEAGLRLYVGATGPSDGGYGAKVMAERNRLAAAAGIDVAKPKAETVAAL